MSARTRLLLGGCGHPSLRDCLATQCCIRWRHFTALGDGIDCIQHYWQCLLLQCLCWPAVFRRKQDGDGAAWGSQRPGSYKECSDDERGQDVKGLTGTADRSPGCGSACEVEE